MQHIIKKQIIDLTLHKKMDAFAVQHLMSERYWQEIVPVLQKAFDSASTEGEMIYIDNLEIDLGILYLKDIERGRWNEEVYKKISEQLNFVSAGNFSDKKVKKRSLILSSADQWIFYMGHGYLPWNLLDINRSWNQKVLEAFASDSVAISKLRFLISTDPAALNRIVYQHSKEYLEALVETLTAEKQSGLSKYIDEIAEVLLFFNQLNKDQFGKKQLVQKLWFQVFHVSATAEGIWNPSNFIVHLLKCNIRDIVLINKLPRYFFSKSRLTAPILKQVKNREIEIEKIDYSPDLPKEETVEIESKISINDEGIFIQYAGIVLLHPFLPMLFKNLQFIKENSFIDEFSHQKAMFLLHYMATGSTTPEEHELVIEKILCAWALEKPVNNLIQISLNEQKEADGLLIEVIQRWEILKKTSFAGLREGFLQRNGKLYTKNNDLHLQIESGAIDMLLDHLPWNLSLIKLPWMNDILRVDWR